MADAAGRLRVGIVSANWGALAHLPAWRLVDGVDVVAICTSRQQTAEEAAERFGVARPFWSYEAMAADPDIDIIDAGTNPLLREKIVTAALQGGKHAVNQLPFTATPEGAETLAALAKAKGLVGAAAASVVGLPHVALMKEMVEAGEIGEVFQVHCSWQMSFFLNIPPGFPYTWFGKAGQGVSVTRNHGSHMLHALRHVFGPIDAVMGHIATRHPLWEIPGEGPMANETDDTSHALLRFANGAMGNVSTSWVAADSPGFTLEALGSKGRLRLDALRYPSIESAKLYFSNESSLYMLPSGKDIAVPDRLMSVSGKLVEPDAGDMWNGGQRVSLGRVFESVAQAIREGGEPVPNFARAAEIQRLIEALYESNARGAWVTT